MGPNTAFKLIKEHKTIENIVEKVKEINAEFLESKGREKYIIPAPERFQYQLARDAFKNVSAFDSSSMDVGVANL